MANNTLLYVLVGCIALSFLPQVAAFGAGNIPAYSYLEDKAFRHGDIEDIIATMCKTVGGGFLSRGTKFSGLDLKRVYMVRNWLRDYSQAVDVGALKKAPLQTILNVVMVLGFLAHGYATGEFEVTKERLGCYLPTEHIDNPKGYADGEDARKYDPRLRGPVDPRELEIDPQSGMKNYIANERGGWDTSSALVRRTLQQCIDMGRRYRQTKNSADEYEAFRLLGQALHTLEDFTAHSNFCELALISLGQQNVFPHVGRNVKVRSPRGRDVHPLVTGTFGGADFIHSLMGEAGDHLSSAAVSDLTKEFANSRSIEQGQSAAANNLRSMFFDLPGSESQDLSREMNNLQSLRATNQDPSTMSPQELHRILWQVLSFRDSVMKRIENTIDRIPGLSSLTEKIGNSVSVFVMTTIEPFVKPLLGTATQALAQSSQAVIDSHDQYEVWNDWNASDPTHSFLAKDHFAVLLNEPAGQIAKVIVQFTVERVVKAWDDHNVNPNQVIDEILPCLFHPDFSTGAQIQTIMLEHMRKWFDSLGQHKNEALTRLTADAVRAGKNKRLGDNSTSTGHVHNQMLPEGGLQQVLNQHNVHVPGANILNAGQDVLSGKMPWQPGFGSGGAHAWRDMDPNDQAAAAAAAPPPGQFGGHQSNWQQPPPQGYQPQHGQGVHYNPPSQPPHGGGGFGGPPPPPGYGGDQFGHGGFQGHGGPQGGHGGQWDDDRRGGQWDDDRRGHGGHGRHDQDQYPPSGYQPNAYGNQGGYNQGGYGGGGSGW